MSKIINKSITTFCYTYNTFLVSSSTSVGVSLLFNNTTVEAPIEIAMLSVRLEFPI